MERGFATFVQDICNSTRGHCNCEIRPSDVLHPLRPRQVFRPLLIVVFCLRQNFVVIRRTTPLSRCVFICETVVNSPRSVGLMLRIFDGRCAPAISEGHRCCPGIKPFIIRPLTASAGYQYWTSSVEMLISEDRGCRVRGSVWHRNYSQVRLRLRSYPVSQFHAHSDIEPSNISDYHLRFRFPLAFATSSDVL